MKPQFPTRHVQLPFGRLAYVESGSGDPCLLVHGNYGSKRWFFDQLASPPQGWRLIAPDLPNCAESDSHHDFSLEGYAQILFEFCDAMSIDRFALVGHSLGGAVAQAVAIKAPERVRCLLLIDSAGPRGHYTSEEHLALLEGFYGNGEALGMALAATAPSNRPEWFPEIVADALLMRREAYQGHARALSDFDITDRTQLYQNPVLILRGELELPHLISAEIARETAAAYRNASFEEWDGVGHSPQLEAPERFNRRFEQFLKEAT